MSDGSMSSGGVQSNRSRVVPRAQRDVGEAVPVLAVARREMNSRRGSLAFLSAVVALVAGVLGAGLAGAWRTATVVDRFVEATNTSQLEVLALSPALAADPAAGVELADALAEVPGVEYAGVAAGFALDIDGDYFMVYSSLDDSSFTNFDRPLLRSGRLPAGPDEIAVNRFAAETLGLGPGDRVSGPTLRTEDMDEVFTGVGFPGFVGDVLDLEVVGVVERGIDLSGRSGSSGPSALASPAFAQTYGDSVGSYVTEVRLRTEDTSAAQVGRVTAAAAEIVGEFEVGVETTEESWSGAARDASRAMGLAVGAFASISALAGLFVVLQAVGREVSVSARSNQTLRSIGMTRRGRVLAAVTPVFVAATIGVALGILGAVGVSGLFPIGDSRFAEVSPGLRFDPWLLVAGLAVLAVAGGWAARTAWVVTRPALSVPPEVRRRLVDRITGLGVSPPVAIGVRMAVVPGTGTRSLPVRSALVGAAVAVIAVTSVLVTTRTADAVASDPARFGWVWSTLPDDLSDDTEATAQRAAEVEGVESIAGLAFATVSIGGDSVPAASLEPVHGWMAFEQVRGRQPVGPSEVALAPGLADELGVDIGDSIELDSRSGGPTRVAVVGIVVAPPIDDIRRDIVVSPEGMEAFAQSEPGVYVAIGYADDADVAAVEKNLEALGYRFTESARPTPPSEVEQFRVLRSMLVTLLAFLAILGATGLLHFLFATTRRRGRDLAVLRALGFERRWVRRTITCQAATTAVIGLLFGVPLGIVAGRMVWRVTVSSLGIIDAPSTPWVQLVVVCVAAVAGAVVVSWWPATIAARREAQDQLRAE